MSLEQFPLHEGITPEPNLAARYGDRMATYFGVTAPIGDLISMCPIDLSDPSMRSRVNEVIVEIGNESGFEVAAEDEAYFSQTVERKGLERNFTVADSEEKQTIVRDEDNDTAIVRSPRNQGEETPDIRKTSEAEQPQKVATSVVQERPVVVEKATVTQLNNTTVQLREQIEAPEPAKRAGVPVSVSAEHLSRLANEQAVTQLTGVANMEEESLDVEAPQPQYPQAVPRAVTEDLLWNPVSREEEAMDRLDEPAAIDSDRAADTFIEQAPVLTVESILQLPEYTDGQAFDDPEHILPGIENTDGSQMLISATEPVLSQEEYMSGRAPVDTEQRLLDTSEVDDGQAQPESPAVISESIDIEAVVATLPETYAEALEAPALTLRELLELPADVGDYGVQPAIEMAEPEGERPVTDKLMPLAVPSLSENPIETVRNEAQGERQGQAKADVDVGAEIREYIHRSFAEEEPERELLVTGLIEEAEQISQVLVRQDALADVLSPDESESFPFGQPSVESFERVEQRLEEVCEHILQELGVEDPKPEQVNKLVRAFLRHELLQAIEAHKEAFVLDDKEGTHESKSQAWFNDIKSSLDELSELLMRGLGRVAVSA